MTLESFYSCVPCPICLLRSFYYGICQLLVNECALNFVDGIGAGWQEKPAVSSALLGGGGGGNLGVILVRVCGPVF